LHARMTVVVAALIGALAPRRASGASWDSLRCAPVAHGLENLRREGADTARRAGTGERESAGRNA
jgi:hypothetical protein